MEQGKELLTHFQAPGPRRGNGWVEGGTQTSPHKIKAGRSTSRFGSMKNGALVSLEAHLASSLKAMGRKFSTVPLLKEKSTEAIKRMIRLQAGQK